MYASKQAEEYIQHITQESLKTPTNTAVVEMFNVLSRGDFTPALAKLDKPVLYVCQPQAESQAKILQAHLTQARVEVFKNAGHALFVDEAEHFNHVLAEFVESLPPPAFNAGNPRSRKTRSAQPRSQRAGFTQIRQP